MLLELALAVMQKFCNGAGIPFTGASTSDAQETAATESTAIRFLIEVGFFIFHTAFLPGSPAMISAVLRPHCNIISFIDKIVKFSVFSSAA